VSWTGQRNLARRYAGLRRDESGRETGVWRTEAPPDALLGRVDLGDEEETVVDPARLGEVDLTGLEPDRWAGTPDEELRKHLGLPMPRVAPRLNVAIRLPLGMGG
jgi:hypothetical protein